jgi:hypothetical protein
VAEARIDGAPRERFSISVVAVGLRGRSWETSKGTLVLDGQVVSFTIGSTTETIGVADIEPFEAAHLTLMQWLGWSGFLMWTGVGLLLAPFMLLVPALLVPFLLLVPTPWMVHLQTKAGRSLIVSIGSRAKAFEVTRAIHAARTQFGAPSL